MGPECIETLDIARSFFWLWTNGLKQIWSAYNISGHIHQLCVCQYLCYVPVFDIIYVFVLAIVYCQKTYSQVEFITESKIITKLNSNANIGLIWLSSTVSGNTSTLVMDNLSECFTFQKRQCYQQTTEVSFTVSSITTWLTRCVLYLLWGPLQRKMIVLVVL